MEIRPARKADLDAIVELWVALQAVGQEADPRYAPISGAGRIFRGFAADQLLGSEPFVRMWVADEGGRLVGMVGGVPMQTAPVFQQGRVARIGEIYVDPGARRSGLGRRLVEAWCVGARAAGYTWLEVGTLVRDARAVAFWRALGFDDMRVTLVHGTSR